MKPLVVILLALAFQSVVDAQQTDPHDNRIKPGLKAGDTIPGDPKYLDEAALRERIETFQEPSLTAATAAPGMKLEWQNRIPLYDADYILCVFGSVGDTEPGNNPSTFVLFTPDYRLKTWGKFTGPCSVGYCTVLNSLYDTSTYFFTIKRMHRQPSSVLLCFQKYKIDSKALTKVSEGFIDLSEKAKEVAAVSLPEDGPSLAGEDEVLRRCLTLLSTVRPGDSYASVKKLVPELGPERPDAGDNNTEALATIQVGSIILTAEFNFSHERLISHGMETLHLSHAAGHDFLIRCMRMLEKLYGPSKRRVDMPWDSDGPQDQMAISFNWHQHRTLLGLDFHDERDFAVVSWGAQAEDGKKK